VHLSLGRSPLTQLCRWRVRVIGAPATRPEMRAASKGIAGGARRRVEKMPHAHAHDSEAAANSEDATLVGSAFDAFVEAAPAELADTVQTVTTAADGRLSARRALHLVERRASWAAAVTTRRRRPPRRVGHARRDAGDRCRNFSSSCRRSTISFSSSMIRCAPARVIPSPIRAASAATWLISEAL